MKKLFHFKQSNTSSNKKINTEFKIINRLQIFAFQRDLCFFETEMSTDVQSVYLLTSGVQSPVASNVLGEATKFDQHT